MKSINASFIILNKDKINGDEVLEKLESIARTCYKSENLITKESKYEFIRGIIKRGHEAMLEHYSLSIKFICDRGISHELVRHRVASFAQESTRYCNYSKDKFNGQVTFINIDKGIELDNLMQKALADKKLNAEDIIKIIDEWKIACMDAEKHYLRMIELGASPNIARSVLNNSTKTEIVITANLREWRHFFSLRADAPAHPQMREETIPLLKELNTLIPVIFEDLYEKFI